MKIKNAPKVIGLIPDGNRRWSKRNSLSLLNGYQLGVQKFIDFSKWCLDYGVQNINVWAFSTENFKRDRIEINMLFNLYKKAASDPGILNQLTDLNTKFRIIGNTRLLPAGLYSTLHTLENKTSKNTSGVINMLIGYGGRDDVMHAAKEYAKRVLKMGRLYDLSSSTFKKLLISSSVPDVDLVIRTSSEERLSDFLPWQIGYAEFYFSDKLWPDFTRNDLRKAVFDYSKRQRRFGK